METEGIRRQLRNTNIDIGDAAEQIHPLLPQDIIIEILSRLSVKSLLRFKCVSKSWRSLISNKHLIKTHFENSKKKETLIMSYVRGGGLSACSMPIKWATSTRTFSLDFYPANYFTRDLCFVGSCNGLICVLVDRYRLLLWNPATREFKELPNFFSDLMEYFSSNIVTYGFGFEESSGDYKVFAACDDTNRFIGKVYSLKADSWVEPRDQMLLFKDRKSPFDATFEVGKFASGKLHWRSKNLGLKSKWEIVCLDLKSETFGIVEQPSCLNDYVCPKLGALKGRLCVFSDYPQCIGLDIWIWNEYGVEDSWAKFATIPYPVICS